MIDGSKIGGIKINSLSGHASLNLSDVTFSSTSVTIKAQGNAFTIGEFSRVWAPMQNGWLDSDGIDQNSGMSSNPSAPVQF